MALISRSQWRAYMDVGTSNTPSYSLIGPGFTQLSEAKNPKEYSRQYVHERTERTDVVGYAPSISYSVDIYDDDAVISKIVEITDKELIGTDAQVDIVAVNTWQASGSSGKVAYKRTYAVIPDARGDGTDALIYTGTLKAVSDITAGVWTGDDDGSFTPDTETPGGEEDPETPGGEEDPEET